MSKKFGGGLVRQIKVGFNRILFGKVNIPKDAVVIGLRRVMLGDNIEEYIEYYEEIDDE